MERKRVGRRFGLKGASWLVVVLGCVAFPIAAYTADRLIIKDDGGAQKLVITDQGKVGINAAAPQVEIDLGGGAITVNGADTTGTWTPRLSWSQLGRLNMGWGGSGGGNLEAYSKGHVDRKGEFRFVYGGGDFGMVLFNHYNGASWSEKMRLSKEGNLTVAGSAWANAWNINSSRNYKQDIRSLTKDEASLALEKLTPVAFRYVQDPAEERLGFIAEDAPELVVDKERKGLNAMEIVAVLTQVVKEQRKTIEDLSAKMASLEQSLQVRQ